MLNRDITNEEREREGGGRDGGRERERSGETKCPPFGQNLTSLYRGGGTGTCILRIIIDTHLQA